MTLRALSLIFLCCAAAMGQEVEFRSALGKRVRPGCWAFIEVSASLPPAAAGLRSPEIQLCGLDGAPLFVSRLSPRLVVAGPERFEFWILPGAEPVTLRFALHDGEGREAFAAVSAEALGPLEADRRLFLSLGPPPPAPAGSLFVGVDPADLPAHAELYAPVDLILLGRLDGRLLAAPREEVIEALAAWVVRGGVALTLDRLWAERLESACGRLAGARQRGIFVTRESARTGVIPPPTLQVGRGRILLLHEGEPADRLVAGRAVWDALAGSFPPLPFIDPRLSPARYEALPGLPTPEPAGAFRLRWLCAWLAACAALLLPPPLRRSPAKAAAALLLCSAGFAALFLRAVPPSDSWIARCRIRSAEEAGPGSPSFDEDLALACWFAAPAGEPLSFADLPPPRLLAPDLASLREARLALEWDEETRTGALRIMARPDSRWLRRGAPALASRRQLGGPLASAPWLCLDGDPPGLERQGAGPVLFDAVLRTTQGKAEWPRLSAGGVPKLGPLPPLRAGVFRLVATGTAPGTAVLAGWTTPEPTGPDLGTLEVHGLRCIGR